MINKNTTSNDMKDFVSATRDLKLTLNPYLQE
jgi:hypothetical protein